MTKKRDLKRRVRARAAATGESYMAARKHVVAEHRPAIAFVELVDLGELARELGFSCKVVTYSDLVARVDPRAVLERLRDALRATANDPQTAQFRAVAFGSARPRGRVRTATSIRARFHFVARVVAGIGGIADDGLMIGLHVGTEPVLCSVQLPARGDGAPQIALAKLAPDEHPIELEPRFRLAR